MCLTCGCGQAHDSHGDPEYLTIDKLQQSEDYKKSAAKDNLSSEQAVKNTLEALENDKKEHPEEY